MTGTVYTDKKKTQVLCTWWTPRMGWCEICGEKGKMNCLDGKRHQHNCGLDRAKLARFHQVKVRRRIWAELLKVKP